MIDWDSLRTNPAIRICNVFQIRCRSLIDLWQNSFWSNRDHWHRKLSPCQDQSFHINVCHGSVVSHSCTNFLLPAENITWDLECYVISDTFWRGFCSKWAFDPKYNNKALVFVALYLWDRTLHYTGIENNVLIFVWRSPSNSWMAPIDCCLWRSLLCDLEKNFSTTWDEQTGGGGLSI